MNDTTPEMDRLYTELLMSRPPIERLRMALSMFDTARKCVEAGIRAKHGDLPPNEMRRLIFLRFYGNDFPPDQLEAILKQL